ncbi:MAG: DoxX family protein [Bacteroidaceae bacterium]|nr:DoxX family protein [Bacteroidaceae bacterium]
MLCIGIKKHFIMNHFLFPQPPSSRAYSALLLVFRIFFGLMLMTHGISKLYNYSELCLTFPDFIGFGHELSLLFAIAAEVICSIGFIFGVLYRLFMIPMLIVMGVAFFGVHHGSIAQGELAFLYFIVFVVMYISGPGKYSIDAKIYRYLHKKQYHTKDEELF